MFICVGVCFGLALFLVGIVWMHLFVILFSFHLCGCIEFVSLSTMLMFKCIYDCLCVR